MRNYDRSYFDKLETMTAEELKGEWIPITLEEAEYLLEVLPPIRWNDPAFMIGECLTYTKAGKLYSAVCKVNEQNYERPAPLSGFDPMQYCKEIQEKYEKRTK